MLASGGYPGEFKKGYAISGLPKDTAQGHVPVFHAGTAQKDGKIVTAGGRVLNVVGLGSTLPEAIRNTYAAMGDIQFKNMHFRRDIGQRVLHQIADS